MHSLLSQHEQLTKALGVRQPREADVAAALVALYDGCSGQPPTPYHPSRQAHLRHLSYLTDHFSGLERDGTLGKLSGFPLIVSTAGGDGDSGSAILRAATSVHWPLGSRPGSIGAALPTGQRQAVQGELQKAGLHFVDHEVGIGAGSVM